jgi:predicted GNAT family N-acyltransferase
MITYVKGYHLLRQSIRQNVSANSSKNTAIYKEATMKIIRKTNQDKDFYTLLGPYLARRDVEREIGYKIYDDDEKTWLVATDNDRVVGFCYLWEKSKHRYQIGSCYVIEDHRQRGVFRNLLTDATKTIHGNVTLTTKNRNLKEMLLNDGFAEKQVKGSFIEYAKEYGDEGI